MKYLFFDTETANQADGIKKMCSFGYVLVDESFNIIESDDILMNPETFWDWYALKRVLAYKKEEYESHPSFLSHYERIKRLVEGDVVVVGYSMKDDLKVLADACNRYKLEPFKMTTYDAQVVYKEYFNEANVSGLDKAAERLNIERQAERHTSLQDARITMQVIEAITNMAQKPLNEVLEFYSRFIYKELSLKGVGNNNLFSYIYENQKAADSGKLLGKRISISSLYEDRHLKTMLLIINRINALGGIYTKMVSEADIFAYSHKLKSDGTFKRCLREEAINSNPERKERIKMINIKELLDLLDIDDNDLIKKEENYKAIKKQYFLTKNKKNECKH